MRPYQVACAITRISSMFPRSYSCGLSHARRFLRLKLCIASLIDTGFWTPDDIAVPLSLFVFARTLS